ncbi:MAG: acyl-CoA thioesterase II [Actinobacteria bacterium]|nr:acyl-CoA thioesterase II [Actinomycetota bacterium]
MPQEGLDELVKLLDLEVIEVNIFRGQSPDENRQRVFGGQVAGQALVAAGRTVQHGSVHSLHAYFLRPGDPTVPIVYEVDRIRDGRSFTTRRVVAVQHGRPIFNLSASFHVHEEGLSHQRPMPENVPDPEGLPPYDWGRGIDLRYVPPAGKGIPRQRLWMRADGKLPDDPLLHVCIVAYASDMSLLDSIMLAHDITWDDPRIMVASLDHAMWFHRPFRADEWLLYDQESSSSSGGRGLGEGHIFRRDGTLVVSVVQEGLVRLVDPSHR